MTALLRAVSIALIALCLVACEADHSEAEAAVRQSQQYFFLEALKQVESGGRQLQSGDLSQAEMSAALETLDQGLRLAFEVQRPFLDDLDIRLGKNFQRYFVEGVENYRLGIEAGDSEQQIRGLHLLGRWAEFWQAEQAAILAQMGAS